MKIRSAESIEELPIDVFHSPDTVGAIVSQIRLLSGAHARREALAALVGRLLLCGELDAAAELARVAPELTPREHVNDVDYWLKGALLVRVADQLLARQEPGRALQLLDEAAGELGELARYEPADLPADPPWSQLARRYRRAGAADRVYHVWEAAINWARAIEQSDAAPDPHCFQPEDGSRLLEGLVAEMLAYGEHRRALETAGAIWHGASRARARALLAQSRGALAALLSGGAEPLAPHERVRHGLALGLLGDPRLPLSDDEWLTSLAERPTQLTGSGEQYWRYVPAGTYWIGGWEAHDPYAGPLERGQRVSHVRVAAFWIARLPVTVAQYARFVAEGYRDGRHWTPSGLLWRGDRAAPEGWGMPGHSGPNQPAVSVNWFEAVACCRWLSERLEGALPHGYELRLPTEAEREVAAAEDGGGVRRPHPWGDEPLTPDRAVSAAWGLTAPAPVGLCPAGAAACGALDLAGGIEEWCGSAAASYPHRADAVARDLLIPSELGPLTAVARGAGWRETIAGPSSGARRESRPTASHAARGLRLALAPRTTSDQRTAQ